MERCRAWHSLCLCIGSIRWSGASFGTSLKIFIVLFIGRSALDFVIKSKIREFMWKKYLLESNWKWIYFYEKKVENFLLNCIWNIKKRYNGKFLLFTLLLWCIFRVYDEFCFDWIQLLWCLMKILSELNKNDKKYV